MRNLKTLGWVTILLAGTMALAQGPGGGGMGPGFGEHRPPMERAFGPQGDHGRWWNNPKVAARLKLTDEQRKAFDGILLSHREKLIDLRASLAKAELGMEPLMGQDQPNEGAILAQIDKVAQARAELEKANARFLLEIRSKLTPEQWKLVQAARAEHGHGGWEDRERGGHDGAAGGNNWRRGGPGSGGPGSGGPGQNGQFHRQSPPPPDGAGPQAPPNGAQLPAEGAGPGAAGADQ